MIAKTRFYLVNLPPFRGGKVLILNKTFSSQNAAREYQREHGIASEFFPMRGEAILHYAEGKGILLHIFEAQGEKS